MLQWRMVWKASSVERSMIWLQHIHRNMLVMVSLLRFGFDSFIYHMYWWYSDIPVGIKKLWWLIFTTVICKDIVEKGSTVAPPTSHTTFNFTKCQFIVFPPSLSLSLSLSSLSLSLSIWMRCLLDSLFATKQVSRLFAPILSIWWG